MLVFSSDHNSKKTYITLKDMIPKGTYFLVELYRWNKKISTSGCLFGGIKKNLPKEKQSKFEK